MNAKLETLIVVRQEQAPAKKTSVTRKIHIPSAGRILYAARAFQVSATVAELTRGHAVPLSETNLPAFEQVQDGLKSPLHEHIKSNA